MTAHFHAVVWIDHSQAKVFHLGLSGADEVALHPHLPTGHLHHKAGSTGGGHAAPDKAFYAEVTKAVADAKAERKSSSAMADARDDKLDAQYKVAKEKCDALSGDAKDACIRDAKLKYHQG